MKAAFGMRLCKVGRCLCYFLLCLLARTDCACSKRCLCKSALSCTALLASGFWLVAKACVTALSNLASFEGPA
jgi:hypothetical protein